jgi:hypothetical protein
VPQCPRPTLSTATHALRWLCLVPGPNKGPFCYSNRRRRPTLSHPPEGEEPKMAPLLGSLLPSDFININGPDPDKIFFLATKQPFHSQVGLFNGTTTQV